MFWGVVRAISCRYITVWIVHNRFNGENSQNHNNIFDTGNLDISTWFIHPKYGDTPVIGSFHCLVDKHFLDEIKNDSLVLHIIWWS